MEEMRIERERERMLLFRKFDYYPDYIFICHGPTCFARQVKVFINWLHKIQINLCISNCEKCVFTWETNEFKYIMHDFDATSTFFKHFKKIPKNTSPISKIN